MKLSMLLVNGVLLLLLLVPTSSGVDQALEDEEILAQDFINELNVEILKRLNVEAEAEWKYLTNITDENMKMKTEVSAENAEYLKKIAKELQQFNYKVYQNEDLKRTFKKLSELYYAALPDDKYRKLIGAITAMESNYATVKVCQYKNDKKCDLQLEPELTDIMEQNENPDELKYYWIEWYNNAGTKVRNYFDEYVALNKEAANLNNYTSGAEMWLSEYEDRTFEQQLENIFDQIRPLYQQLHAYVRHSLRSKYGDIVSENGPIPMHLLGNMWAQTWSSVAKFTTPYPSKPLINVTDEMHRQGYTPLKMFQMADDFFQSLNMTKMPKLFWEKSVIEAPTDGRKIVCHASASDMYKKDDVRIKQCTRVNMEQFQVVHHEMGHIEYFLQYQHLPVVYREGANPGFHEAVGDLIGLSVNTPKHLTKIGLLKDYDPDDMTKINQLYSEALQKIIFLPFAFTLDKYRWGIFRGEIKPDEYNCKFWKLREEYSGIIPPVQRYETDFDPTAKYHISADVEYLRYLVSFIIQFQFHKGACQKAGEYVAGDPEKTLSDCDIYQSKDAGNAIKAMLSMGSSKPWPDAMEVLTGGRKMDASAILEYFKPLEDWLVAKNKEMNIHIGWERTYQCQKSPRRKRFIHSSL